MEWSFGSLDGLLHLFVYRLDLLVVSLFCL